MNSATEKTAYDDQASSTASNSAKRSWQSPEIEEVDFAETQQGPNAATDGNGSS